MSVPPVGFAGHFCWGLPRAALGKKKNPPLDFNNLHIQFLGGFFLPHRAWCIKHMLYFSGIKHAMLDYLSGHAAFHCTVWCDCAVSMVQVAGLSAWWLSVLSTACVTARPPWKMCCS